MKKLSKKGLEMKILMTWLFVIIASIFVIILIAVFTSRSNDIVNIFGNMF